MLMIIIPTCISLRNRQNQNSITEQLQPTVELISRNYIKSMGAVTVIKHAETGCQFIGRYNEWELIPGTCNEVE